MEINKHKVIVCGDSFCSSHNYERNHFSQILEDEYGYSVINLARGGCGTVNICFQIREAIALSADTIVYSRTSPGRIEVPITGKSFDVSLGLKNFIHPFPDETTYNSPLVGGLDAPFFSDGLGSLQAESGNSFVDISPELRNAVKQYIMFMFDTNLKQETDNWAYEYWENQIVKAGIHLIPFAIFGKPAYEFGRKTNGQYPTCYHTDRATQDIVAKNIHLEIKRIKG